MLGVLLLCLSGVAVYGQVAHHEDIHKLWLAINRNDQFDDYKDAISLEEFDDFFRFHFGDSAAIVIELKDFIPKWEFLTGDSGAVTEYMFKALDFNQDGVLSSYDLDLFFKKCDVSDPVRLLTMDEWNHCLSKVYELRPSASS